MEPTNRDIIIKTGNETKPLEIKDIIEYASNTNFFGKQYSTLKFFIEGKGVITDESLPEILSLLDKIEEIRDITLNMAKGMYPSEYVPKGRQLTIEYGYKNEELLQLVSTINSIFTKAVNIKLENSFVGQDREGRIIYLDSRQ